MNPTATNCENMQHWTMNILTKRKAVSVNTRKSLLELCDSAFLQLSKHKNEAILVYDFSGQTNYQVK